MSINRLINKKTLLKYITGISVVILIVLAVIFLAGYEKKQYNGIIHYKDDHSENVSFEISYRKFDMLFRHVKGNVHITLADKENTYFYTVDSDINYLKDLLDNTADIYTVWFSGLIRNQNHSIEDGSFDVGRIITDDFHMLENVIIDTAGYLIYSSPLDENLLNEVKRRGSPYEN